VKSVWKGETSGRSPCPVGTPVLPAAKHCHATRPLPRTLRNSIPEFLGVLCMLPSMLHVGVEWRRRVSVKPDMP